MGHSVNKNGKQYPCDYPIVLRWDVCDKSSWIPSPFESDTFPFAAYMDRKVYSIKAVRKILNDTSELSDDDFFLKKAIAPAVAALKKGSHELSEDRRMLSNKLLIVLSPYEIFGRYFFKSSEPFFDKYIYRLVIHSDYMCRKMARPENKRKEMLIRKSRIKKLKQYHKERKHNNNIVRNKLRLYKITDIKDEMLVNNQEVFKWN